jgi:hypothetical protein
MLRINLEISNGNTLRQIGELHVVKWRQHGCKADYAVLGWRRDADGAEYGLEGRLLGFNRSLDALELAKQALVTLTS